jgi:hypothetical protein
MIPALIFWLIRRYRRYHAQKNPGIDLKKIKKQFFRIACILLLVILFLSLKSHSQNRLLNYKILRNGNKVGTVRFRESNSGNMKYLQIESEVKTRFIFSFNAHAKEEAVYSNGVLQHSSIYRKLNGNEKVNKQHQMENNRYLIHAGTSESISKVYPITYNMLCLYRKEPVNITAVYSDNFETFLTIQKMEAHQYKITLPDGNYNYYRYKDGILNEIEIHHTFYSANIVLAQ